MRGRRPWALFLAVIAGKLYAQPLPPVIEGPAPTTPGVERALKIITDDNASDEVRRIGAEDLLRLDEPAATEEAVRLLQSSDPSRAKALCEALAAVGGDIPPARNRPLVEPLVELLSSEQPEMPAKAALALSVIADAVVSSRLGRLAGDEATPLSTRLAALDALAMSTDRRDSVDEIVKLLRLPEEQIVRRGIAALRQVSRRDYGDDVGQWEGWWQSRKALDECQWSKDRATLYWQRIRDLNAGCAEAQARAAAQQRTLARRLSEQIEATYRLTPQGQREDVLLQWLEDPILEYRSAALSLLAASVADGNRPSPAIRASLRQFPSQDAPEEIKLRALDLMAALNDPADTEVVLHALDSERSPAVREALYRTLGRLQNPAALPALRSALQDPGTSEACLIAAVNSIGLLGSLGKVDGATVAPFVQPLLNRYTATSPDSIKLRAAFVGAMANLGSPEFKDVFVANIESTSTDVLLAALQGVTVVRADVSVETLLALMGHEDPRVRRRAIEAIGVIGGEPNHLEALANRLNPRMEANETVREAAWKSYQAIVSRLPAADRLAWAERLRAVPDRYEALLQALTGDLVNDPGADSELVEARLRLATLLDSQQRWTESLPIWEQLGELIEAGGDPRTSTVRARILLGALELRQYERLEQLVPAVARSDEPAVMDELRERLLSHLRDRIRAGDSQGVAQFRAVIRRLPPGLLGEEFLASFEKLAAEPPPTTQGTAASSAIPPPGGATSAPAGATAEPGSPGSW